MLTVHLIYLAHIPESCSQMFPSLLRFKSLWFKKIFKVNFVYYLIVQGLSVPFACVGSGDPVRVLCLYTTNTLDTLWSIYCWDICTTCRYRIYVLCAQALGLWDFLLLIRTGKLLNADCRSDWLTSHCTVQCFI